MEFEVTKFSQEVIEQLDYYVYRLIDPRNGLTFYVGKGKGNRLFQHLHEANKVLDESIDSLKMQTIKEIQADGLEPIHIIQRWGIKSEDIALEVEAALIDVFFGLTNIQKGTHSNDHGVCNAWELQNRLGCTEYDDSIDLDYMIIKTTQKRIGEVPGSYPEALYYATRNCWKVGKNEVNNLKHKYCLAVVNGIVKEVYEIQRWLPVEDECGRYEFEGIVAPEKIRGYFINHRIPEKYRAKGIQSPVLYKKP